MTRDVYYVDPDESLPAVWDMMKKLVVRHVPVLESSKPVGMISDRDILLRASVGESGIVIPLLDARTVMATHLITCLSSASLSAVGLQMLSHKIDSVVIVNEEGELAGLITSSDFIHLTLEREALDVHSPPPYEFRVQRLPR
jgi:IMP dehydrogenase